MIKKFRDAYKGETMWIVGKGPSLQFLTKKHIGLGPIITINEAIIKIEEIGLPNPVFSMQKDGGDRRQYKNSYPLIFKPDCDYKSNCGDRCGAMYRPKKGATLLVHKHESLYCFSDYSPRYVFDWKELGLLHSQFSQLIAVKIGILMGCNKFQFVSFDALIGCIETYVPNIGIVGIRHGYIRQKRRIRHHLVGLNCEWIIPKEKEI